MRACNAVLNHSRLAPDGSVGDLTRGDATEMRGASVLVRGLSAATASLLSFLPHPPHLCVELTCTDTRHTLPLPPLATSQPLPPLLSLPRPLRRMRSLAFGRRYSTSRVTLWSDDGGRNGS